MRYNHLKYLKATMQVITAGRYINRSIQG
jgi:hypothetical protein